MLMISYCVSIQEKSKALQQQRLSEDGGFRKGTRFAFANDQFFFKTEKQMLDTGFHPALDTIHS